MSYQRSLVVSDALPVARQGVGASTINTVVNLSVSFSLGIPGTVVVHADDGGADPLNGQRGAGYLAIGLSGLGIFVALFLCRVPHRGKSAMTSADETASVPDQMEAAPGSVEGEEVTGKAAPAMPKVEMGIMSVEGRAEDGAGHH